MGAANPLFARSRKPMRRDTFAQALEIYARDFAGQDGKVRATFEILYLCGWSPHESQQKPLKPGSAKARLADALRTSEIAAGDKASFPRRDKQDYRRPRLCDHTWPRVLPALDTHDGSLISKMCLA